MSFGLVTKADRTRLHISAYDLIKTRTNGEGNTETYSLLIDFHPGSTTRIGIIVLLDIYAYTYAGKSSDVAD